MPYDLRHNLDRYKSCFCNKNGGYDIVELLDFPQEKSGMLHIFRQEVIFMVQGSANLTLEGMGIGQKLKKGEFIFLPSGSHLAYDVTRGSSMLTVCVPEELPECPVLRITNPSEDIPQFKDYDGMYALKINSRLRSFVSEIMITLEDGFLCRHFLQNEASRLMFLIHAYYPEKERVKFFSHVLTPDMKFSEFVRMNHMKYRTIGELSEAICMNSQTFSNRFKKVFGMTPHKWTQQEKARHIYLDICHSKMPLKDIAKKYDFPLSSNFFRFCKLTFGESPGSIRKSINKNISSM